MEQSGDMGQVQKHGGQDLGYLVSLQQCQVCDNSTRNTVSMSLLPVAVDTDGAVGLCVA